jgi:hypothetical protein
MGRRRNKVGTARCAVRAASSGAMGGVIYPFGHAVPPAAARAGTPQARHPYQRLNTRQPPRRVPMPLQSLHPHAVCHA